MQHHFQVSIPDDPDGSVLITENFMKPDPDLPITHSDYVKRRVRISHDQWMAISQSTKYEFNERLKKDGKKVSEWKIGFNQLPAHFGKELVLLAWAIEDAPVEKIPTAIQNWLGLVPEERWWLYTQANAATGHAEYGKGKGWRRAIQIALTENPLG